MERKASAMPTTKLGSSYNFVLAASISFKVNHPHANPSLLATFPLRKWPSALMSSVRTKNSPLDGRAGAEANDACDADNRIELDACNFVDEGGVVVVTSVFVVVDADVDPVA